MPQKPPDPVTILETALSMMAKRYEGALTTRQVITKPLEVLYDWADILRAVEARLKKVGYAK